MYDEFVSKLVDFTKGLKVADPIGKEAFTGPVIDEAAVDRYLSAVNEVKQAGGEILIGGAKLDDELADGNFVAPTVAAVDESSWVWDRELFVPFVVVGKVRNLDEALEKSNDTAFGLTAGLFSKDESEIEAFFEANIEHILA